MAKYNIENAVLTVNKGVLIRVDYTSPIDVLVIPEKVGKQEIHSIQRAFRNESLTDKKNKPAINTVILNDNITFVDEESFFRATVKNVVWSKSCKTIPNACFAESDIETISNIENVESIEVSAFQATRQLKDFIWPKSCLTVPCSCFCTSGLQSITGLENVESIENNAFAYSKINSIEWPEKAKTVSTACFFKSQVGKIAGLDGVISVEPAAFAECHNLTELAFGYALNLFHYSAFSSRFLKKMDMRASSLVDMELFDYIKHAAEENNAEYLLPYFIGD